MDVKSISRDGKERKLVYQNSLLLVDKNDSVYFDLKDGSLMCKVKFTFSSEGKEYSTTHSKDESTGIITYVLHKWEAHTWIEVSEPLKIKFGNTKDLFLIKIRTEANGSQPYRQFDITVWREFNG